eukprot:scaffold15555_cov180-Amphora_coffeaeformis.AAC.10
MGLIMTILCCLANVLIKSNVGPRSASSAKSHQGCFSRVHMKNGPVQHSCKATTLAPAAAAAWISTRKRSCKACRWTATGAVVGWTMAF